MGKFFDSLKAGLEEAIEHDRGKKTLRTRSVELPKPPLTYAPEEITRIRNECNYSQGIFAKVLNVSKKTVQSWESGRRVPSHSALRLLEIVDKGIYRPGQQLPPL